MALFINGVGRDTFNMNGVDIDNLYVNGDLVFSSDTEGVIPDAPTSFASSDDQSCQITFSWTNSTVGTPTPTYDIYYSEQELPIAEGVTSPYVYPGNTTLARDYYVVARNSAGTSPSSNIDSGVAIDGSPDATVLSATNNQVGQVTLTWTPEYLIENVYNLYDADDYEVPLADHIVSPHVYVMAEGTKAFFVDAVNICTNKPSNSVLGVSLGSEVLPPVYNLTENMVNIDSYWNLVNSAQAGTEYYPGKMVTDVGGIWVPNTDEYPYNGTVTFGVNRAEIGWTPPQSTIYTQTFIYDIDFGTSYTMASIVPQGDNLTANVLYNGVLAAKDTGLNYVPPSTPLILNDNVQYELIPVYPLCDITLSQYAFGIGDTATVTFTFNTVVIGFNDTYIEAENGSITNLVQDTDSPWIWTATFTPDANVTNSTNVIRTLSSMATYSDAWNNVVQESSESANYTVNTGTAAGDILFSFNDNLTNTGTGTATAILPVDITYVTDSEGERAASFDGSNSKFQISGLSQTYPISIFMVYTNRTPVDKDPYLSFVNGITLYIVNSKLNAQSSEGSYDYTSRADNTQPDGTIIKAVVTFDSATTRPKIYIDGLLQSTNAGQWWKNAGTTDLVGGLDGTRIPVDISHLEYFYNTELTQEEITALVNNYNA